MEVFIQSEDIQLIYEFGQMWVLQEDKKTPVNLQKLDRIWLKPSSSIQGELLLKLMEAQVELYICSDEGTPEGTLSPWTNPKGARARKRQLLFSISSIAQRLAGSWIIQKQERQWNLLNQYPELTKPKTREKIKAILAANQSWLKEEGQNSITDLQEAYFARLYFKLLKDILPEPFKFEKRSRNPALDFFNAGLNYGYGIFYGMLQGHLQHFGIDPYIGFWHKERDGHPVLVYDLIEPFRPWVEEVCLTLATHHLWTAEDFSPHLEKGWWLGDSGKSKLITAIFDFLDKPGNKGRTRREEMAKHIKDLRNTIHHFPIDL